MGFQKNWIVNPSLSDKNDDLAGFEPVPAHQKWADGGVGDKIAMFYASQVPGNVEVDPDVWALSPESKPLVLAQDLSSGTEIWIERAFLADPDYESTVRECQTRAEQLDMDLASEFWKRKETEYGALTDTLVELTKAAPALKGAGGRTELQPGSYQVLGTNSRKLANQLAPFTVVLQTPAGPMLVDPASLDEGDDSAADEAKAKGVATELTATTIVAPFAGLPVIRAYLPGGQWLTDGNVRYVTPEEMGAVFVLKRPPEPGDVATARRTDQELFDAGAGTPGVRYVDNIFIQRSHLGIGVEYHEAIHRLSQPAVRAVLGFDFNEGVTEYFTRQLLAPVIQNGEVIRDEAQYRAQHDGVRELVSQGVMTEEDLAAAYFAGRVKLLFTRAADRLGPGFSLQGYAMSVTSRNHLGAEQLLAEIARKAH
jgi:hypothetical protein